MVKSGKGENMTEQNIKRVQIRLPEEQWEKLKYWSHQFGITMAQLGGMATQGGLDAIIRAVSPMDSIKPEQWADLVKAMENKQIPEDELSKYGY